MNKEEDEDEDEEEEEEEENPNKPLIPLNTKCSFKPVCFKYSPRIYELTNLENRVLKILDQQLRITCGDEIVDNFPRYLPAYDAFYDDFQYAFNSSASSFLSNNTSSNSSHTISSGSSSLYNQYSIDYPKVPTFFTQTSYQQFQHKLFVCIANIEENKRRRRAVCNSNMKYTLNTKNNCNQKITFHSMKNNIGVF
ncbi:hypothetical protein PACTADRAFT_51401 [Pachysolen tannophilus NRRL Y-2460]|uniref:Uncharacterized protein n=1 Tax=Pachysolen tannophilus NRRL Y-2460 TaxID=669874 RepID=A0A1E4TPD6_PACTA|nr:hypothetical protein PACTADRAFT_51401 [Pachysolen tannophilus NRRL Y-2460]